MHANRNYRKNMEWKQHIMSEVWSGEATQEQWCEPNQICEPILLFNSLKPVAAAPSFPTLSLPPIHLQPSPIFAPPHRLTVFSEFYNSSPPSVTTLLTRCRVRWGQQSSELALPSYVVPLHLQDKPEYGKGPHAVEEVTEVTYLVALPKTDLWHYQHKSAQVHDQPVYDPLQPVSTCSTISTPTWTS